MKQLIYKILLSALAVLALSSTVAFLILGQERRSRIECSGLVVTVKDSADNHFVTGRDVQEYIRTGYGKVVGTAVRELKLNRIEEVVTGKSAVLNCEAYITPDGVLNLDVTQRRPKVRFQTASNGWYADADGFIFPLQRSYTCLVPIVDGEFPMNPGRGFKGMLEDGKEKDWMKRVVSLVEYMEKTGWDKRITQIHVDRNGEITLVPARRCETFLFGQPDRFPDKFRKMEKYYRMIAPLDRGYAKVDLRYDSQIVCSEKRNKA